MDQPAPLLKHKINELSNAGVENLKKKLRELEALKTSLRFRQYMIESAARNNKLTQIEFDKAYNFLLHRFKYKKNETYSQK